MALQDPRPASSSTPLERLAACEDIRQLKARYFRLVDAKRWDELGMLFTADAVFERGLGSTYRNPLTGAWSSPPPAAFEAVTGRAAILAMIRGAVEHLWTVHRGSDAEITVSSPHAAAAIWAMTDDLRAATGKLLLRGWGHYEEIYRREDGRWLIARTRLTRQYLEQEGQG